MSRELDNALASFPVIAWASEHMRLYDKGRQNVYADCPICDGKKTLGIDREKKIFHCFRCNEGGHGAPTWNGRAHVIKMIAILERCSFKRAIEKIFKLAGFPDPPVEYVPIPKVLIPPEAISLSKASQEDPSVLYLKRRGMGHLVEKSFVCLRGEYEGRIILPTNYLGEKTGFEAKAYAGKKPPSKFPEWFDSYGTLYTTPFDLSLGFCVITESIFDSETIGLNAVGCYGGFKEGQFDCLLDLKSKGISKFIWMLDWDAWKKQTKAILTKSLGWLDNYVVNMPRDSDPNDLGRDVCWKLLKACRRVKDEFDLIQLAIEFGQSI